MSRVLGLVTSGPFCGAALWDGTDVVAAAHEEMAKGQAERLMPLAQELLAEADCDWTALDALGVGVGPGNFTGIRIAVAAVRGLALALDIPAVGVSALEALALDAPHPVLASIQAGRDSVYLQRFGPGLDHGPERVAFSDVTAWAAPGLTCIGNQAEEIAAQIGADVGPAPYYPASAVARIAATRWADAPAPPAPLYFRPADAAPARDDGLRLL